MDVKSLYTNIPNSEAIAATKRVLYNKHKSHHNIFVTYTYSIQLIFNRKSFLPTQGNAMRTTCAPSYANIFIAEFEGKYI